MAFEAVMHLWGRKPLKVYGNHMSESILTILGHIIKGEATIKVGMGTAKTHIGTGLPGVQ